MSITPGTRTTGGTHAVITSFSISLPSFSAGDIFVVIMGINGATTPLTLAAGTNWVEIGTAGGASVSHVRIQAFVCTTPGSAGTSFAVSGGSGTQDIGYVCVPWSGVDTTTPIDSTGTAGTSTSNANVTVGPDTIVNSGSLMCGGVVDWNAGSTFSTNSGSATTYLLDNGSPVNFVATCQCAQWYKNATDDGASFSIHDNAGATGNFLAAICWALKPAGAAFPGDDDEGGGWYYQPSVTWQERTRDKIRKIFLPEPSDVLTYGRT